MFFFCFKGYLLSNYKQIKNFNGYFQLVGGSHDNLDQITSASGVMKTSIKPFGVGTGIDFEGSVHVVTAPCTTVGNLVEP